MVGTLPPITDDQWQEAFAKYQRTPEYRQVNHDMSLQAFKGIFWWEYFHRLLGRAIGVVFLAPLLWFLARGKIARTMIPKLFGIFVLGGLQGALGWYMVKSGLVDDPRVSQFRLTAHLGLAMLIFAAMLWAGLSLVRPKRDRVFDMALEPLRRWSAALAALVFLMILTGGLVAGIRAGLAYNTFPLMNGHVVPPEIMMIDPWYKNFFYNMATVQFVHRVGAWALALLVPVFWWRVRSAGAVPSQIRTGANLLLAMLILQIALGVSTLVLIVPLALAAAHQAGAVLLFAASLNEAHALRWSSKRRRVSLTNQGESRCDPAPSPH